MGGITRRYLCGAVVAGPRPTSFRSLSVAKVAALPNARESVTGVQTLRDGTLPELSG